MRNYFGIIALALLTLTACGNADKVLHVVTTGDVHGSYFNEAYIKGQASKTSLMAVSHYVDSLRAAVGKKNVLLLDAGDILQGDNASYYFNYVEPDVPHVYPQIASYMGYDAVVVGNHDIETGHKVFDKVASELKAYGIPWLGGNIVDAGTGKPYFSPYAVFRKAGMKVLVLGFSNANIKAWVAEEQWTGLDFLSLTECVQGWVDFATKKERPDVVIVVVHSGTGEGDGTVLENQGIDLLDSLKGVDLVVTAHDHVPAVIDRDDIDLVNGGSRAGYVGHAVITVGKDGKNSVPETVRLNKRFVNTEMVEAFRPQFDKVAAFTLLPVGQLTMDLRTRDAFKGMSDYINLIQTVQLETEGVDVSIAAPLTFNGTINAGMLVYNDMFTIYPYENQLFVMKMTGLEIRRFLEYSYDAWIQTPGSHVLKIVNNPDPRGETRRWSFTGRTFDFDSAAGIVYTVDVTKPFGRRIDIKSMADGRPFDETAWYNVALTSYRASGGGDTVTLGAGIARDEVESRIIARYPEIRDMIYRYIRKNGTVTPELTGDANRIGGWKFVPESAVPMIENDFRLVFGD